MLGAIVGDIVGSIYEFNNCCDKDFLPFFHPQAKITDDTVCTVAVADILLNQKDPATTLRDWCLRYEYVGGWGARFGQWFKREPLQPYGSFGNGAAMRVSPAAFLADSEEQALAWAEMVTVITHDHPEGIKGAQATTLAIYRALQGEKPAAIRAAVSSTYGYDLSLSVDQIRPNYRYNESCQGCVPQAITCALEAFSFEDAIRNAISIGGDSDTIAAIAGGIAEARFGVPESHLGLARYGLTADMKLVLDAMYARRCA
ncbi:MAG: hypothetical protein RLZZ298_3160 [Pseudomonadota bacterium]|jgi:ADP-ribosylglycohydrolase